MSPASDLILLAAAGLLTGSVLTAAARWVAVRAGVLDRPDGARKLHRAPTPLMGGAAIYVSLLSTVLLGLMLPGPASLLATLPAGALPMLLVSGAMFCGLGLYDDVRPMRPWRKLLCQFVAALPFAMWGQKVAWIEFLGFDMALGAAVGAAFTALWIVACANTINLIDGLDGLAGTIGLIACVGTAAVADIRGMPGVAAVALVAAGSLTGFLCHNLPPARIFLGDSGSLLIGFLIGVLTIESSLKTAAGFAMTVPVILVSIPAFDTCMAILRRRLSGRGIGEGDRGHIHHRLQDRGLTRTQTLIVIAGLCSVMTALTVLCVSFHADRLCLGLCVGLLGLLIAGRVFGHNEALLFLRRVQRVGQLLMTHSTLFGARAARSPETWDAAVDLVRRFGVTRLEFVRFDERTEAVADQKVWVDASAPLSTSWELRVSSRSAGGERLTLSAYGDHRLSAVAAGLAELFSLLDDCCRGWALTAGLPATGSLAAAGRLAPRPRLVPGEAGDSVRRAA